MLSIQLPTDFIQAYLERPEQRSQLIQRLSTWATSEPTRLLDLGPAILELGQQEQHAADSAYLYRYLLQISCTTEHPVLMDIGLRLLGACPFSSMQREGIARLVSHHDGAMLVEKALALEVIDLLPLLLHEAVIRGQDLRQHHQYEALLPFKQCHGWQTLPLYPLPEESMLSFPFFSIHSQSQTIDFGFPERGFHAIDRQALPQMEFSTTPNPRILTAVRHWEEDSNGDLYGVTGSFRQGIPVEHWIPQLPPFAQCEGIVLAMRSPQQIFAKIFSAASNSGAYGASYYGAVGRRNTWLTLGALLQLPPDTAALDIAHAMQQVQWWEFGTDTWFINSWLDLGVVASWIDDEGRTQFGLLAATDTD